jgi:hypothetical protein
MGTSIAFPDVCKTPSPAGPVPIPYPNVAMSSDTMSGSKTVKMDGNEIMIKGANMKMSTGDEAGAAMGVASNKIKGKAEFVNYSFDVKVDGKNVCRLVDPTTQNMGSANSFGPAHIQGPLLLALPQLKGCMETRKKQREQNIDKKTAWKKSGVYSGHQPKIQRVVDEMKVIIYFRQSNHWCADNNWIPNHHKPKPHEVIAAKTIAEANVMDVQIWMDGFFAEGEFAAQIHGAARNKWKSPPPLPHDAKKLFGVVMSMESYRLGEPLRGYGSDSNGYSYKGKWISGDYDLMDIMYTGDLCERPDQDSEAQFGRIKRALNKAMGWDGIQHGPQSQWVAKKSHGDYDDFSIPQKLKAWLKAPAGTPVTEVAISDKRKLPIGDKQSTVVAPKGKVIQLEKEEDVKNALICCGCAR